ncbi:MAG: endonuclease/exonuclease/phosphatase family protein [Gammaproteobacteria bacterium]
MSDTPFTLLSLNIHKGFALGPKRLVLNRIRDCLRDSNANIVFLQEVVGVNHRHQKDMASWPSESQLEFLADSVWQHHAYGKNAIYQHGHHGNAILSALPFERLDNINASIHSFSQRGFLHGTITGNIHLICVHLGLFESERKLQITHLIDHIHRTIPADEAFILAGDFNDWRGTAHKRLMNQLHVQEVHESANGRIARTYPAFLPVLPMDRIYVRGFEIEHCSSFAGHHWRDFSDHKALIAKVQLHPLANKGVA